MMKSKISSHFHFRGVPKLALRIGSASNNIKFPLIEIENDSLESKLVILNIDENTSVELRFKKMKNEQIYIKQNSTDLGEKDVLNFFNLHSKLIKIVN